MLTVLHASDLQCGRPFRRAAAEAFLRLASESAPDVVVVSGDLTQRAKDREFVVASKLLERLAPVPCVVTPGNHDVPLYRVLERLFMPYVNWRRRISPELDSVTRVEGATFVALNSSAPRRAIVNGRIDPHQIDFAHRAFETSAPTDARVLVIHHHFVSTPDGTGGGTLPRAKQLAAEFEKMDVDCVLGGHVHQTHVTTSDELLGPGKRPGIPFIACGTTTSRRGRGVERGRNSLNVIRVRADEIEVVPHLAGPDASSFEPSDAVVLPRRVASGRADARATGEGPQ